MRKKKTEGIKKRGNTGQKQKKFANVPRFFETERGSEGNHETTPDEPT
jgi:hypothetical protein